MGCCGVPIDAVEAKEPCPCGSGKPKDECCGAPKGEKKSG